MSYFLPKSKLHLFLQRVPTIVLCCKVFFACLEQGSSLDSRLVKKGLQFRDNLTKQYNWDFSSEPDEYAPTIVDTDCSWDNYVIVSWNNYVIITSHQLLKYKTLKPHLFVPRVKSWFVIHIWLYNKTAVL